MLSFIKRYILKTLAEIGCKKYLSIICIYMWSVGLKKNEMIGTLILMQDQAVLEASRTPLLYFKVCYRVLKYVFLSVASFQK